MKRLISKKEIQPEQLEQQKDEWIDKAIEITNGKSKFYGFRGIVYKATEKSYILKLEPAPYENTDRSHIIHVPMDRMYKWVRLLPQE